MSETHSPVYRNVLVIGGTGGLGQAVALEFAQLAQTVHLTYHGRRAAAEKIGAAVAERGGTAEVHQLTLPDPDTRGTGIRKLLTRVTPCDVVVNCAVAGNPAVATVSNAEEFKSVIDANVFGAYQVNSISAQAMAGSGGGTVVNVSSVITRRYIVGAVGYVSSKAALEAMTRGFAREWGGAGVRFNTVSPGPIRDTRLLSMVPAQVIDGMMAPGLEERLVSAQQVASVIRAVAGADFAAMNGEVVVVDEGFSL
ncbi:SDR family oxidoreductase [Streptomyces angustmyceticus]|uniref:Beta-ketoacyl-ACP reductase n=1 Tax=Streptomyces angustmyceticus TaxID=285578 RepID=A0A5J4LQ96_9ACTN|nr:SDR family oxidoreductase [Streptomyces angustmyceticus]UAL66015.1 SDR family oxidoreductase [Streptomyces angustmyceticus]GES33669.1 beta-ketoacyl-ACP reductase [Streptomyces angustmyceticus]